MNSRADTSMDTFRRQATVSPPVRQSPLHEIHVALGAEFEERAGWQVPALYTSVDEESEAVRERVAVADMSAAGKLRIKGRGAHDVLATAFDSVPDGPGTVSVVRAVEDADLLARLTGDEFLLVTAPCERSELQAITLQVRNYNSETESLAVVDITSGLAGILVAGPASRSLLSKLCALPFHPNEFPTDHVAQSSLAKVHAVVIRHDVEDVPAFHLYVDRSYGVYVWRTVMDAGQEFGAVPVGQHTLTTLANKQ